jgi:large subunit ribosomal protein L24
MVKYKLKKGDKVVVIAGKDKGKEGDIVQILRSANKVLVSGVNMVKKHQKASPNESGGLLSKEMPLHVSNIAFIDPKTKKATRIGYKTVDGKKARFAKESGEVIGN